MEEHVRQENRHDLDGIMATFGADAWYDDHPVKEHHEGHDGVRDYYGHLLQALPDLHIEIHRRHVTAKHVILELTLSGTHTGVWRGLPGTGHPIEFPVCAVFSFDERNRLAGERIYYDRATILRQLGVFRDPEDQLGRLLTPLIHPVTMARALVRAVRKR